MASRSANFFKSIFATVLVAVGLTLAAVRPAQAQVDKWGAWENGITESWWMSSKTFTNEDLANAIDRWKLIGLISSPGWEGDYFAGSEVHGTYVRWSKTGFVIADVDKCQALVMSLTFGRVNITRDVIEFITEFSKSSKSHGHQPHKRDASYLSFIPIKWRDQLYLVPKTELTDFSDYAAGLGHFNALNGVEAILPESHFYSKYVGKSAGAGDFPVFPERYRQFLKEPITAKIVAVGDRKLQRKYSYEFSSNMLSFANEHELASLTFVTVNIGSRHGARKDFFLRVIKPNLGESLRLIEVGPTSSKAVLVRAVEKGKESYFNNEQERTYPRVSIGWRLTSALPD